MKDFTNIEYLKFGNERQQKAYRELKRLNIFESLKQYNPILTGTIPINIDLPDSDLDIICEIRNHKKFSAKLRELFGNKTGFETNFHNWSGFNSIVAKFKTEHFVIEIFGQNIPTEKQNAYQHMIIEHKLLKERGEKFRKRIIKLKENGYKTEPAFAIELGLEGNPYEALLELKIE
jgi:hypothetical protein